ncbi:MAG: hypothetical protein U1F68_18460 [Gammaproteobacteria bacterium]
MQRFADGYALTLAIERTRYIADGGRSAQGAGGFQAIGQVDLMLERAGEIMEIGAGQTLYRDERAPVADQRGSMRQLCEILDYRYARYAGGPAYRLDPFIARGFWRDVQGIADCRV